MRRALAGRLIKTTLSEVGRSFSMERRTREEIQAFADALADMLWAYVKTLGEFT